MKTTLNKKLALGLTFITLMGAPGIYAFDSLVEDTSNTYDSDQIDVDGTFEEKRESQADKLEKMRKKLEQKNEDMVSKKIEDMRIKEEIKLTRKLHSAFNGGGGLSSAPAFNAAKKLEMDSKEKKSLVVPTLGYAQYDGNRVDGFESNMSFGVAMENMVTPRISVGVGIDYTTMNITNKDNSLYPFYNYNNYYNQYNYNFNYDDDEINYKRLTLGVRSKFYMAVNSSVRPFIGGQLSYNRTNLKYDKRGRSQGYGFKEDDVAASGTNFTGTAMIGADIDFTDSIGMTVELDYAKALTTGFNSESDDGYNYSSSIYDETVLETLGEALEESDVTTVKAGVVFKF